MKTLIRAQDELFRLAADKVCSLLREKPDAALTLAAGRTMFPLWELLCEAAAGGEADFSAARFFQTAEFLGVPEEKSLRRLTEERLLRKIGIPEENCFWLTEENAGRCDEAIRRCGGLDLAVLGLGVNAHIGYNEPGTQFSTGCRVQKLTGKTKQQLAWLFPDAASVPEKAVTMGIRTLTQAKEILVLAVGEEKAKAVFDMLYARDDSVIPAAFLQIPANVTVYADPAAGSRL
ncbi:MAG: glucosamine-6-phosphate deaminase [Oscillospiraceae bacterium]|nr:glucosamine-6-phosphate deaminase [Oscillospiraceae bacterium]